MTEILVRKDRKQSWTRAGTVELLDPPKRVEQLAEQLNTQAGFEKFKTGTK